LQFNLANKTSANSLEDILHVKICPELGVTLHCNGNYPVAALMPSLTEDALMCVPPLSVIPRRWPQFLALESLSLPPFRRKTEGDAMPRTISIVLAAKLEGGRDGLNTMGVKH